MSLCKQDHTKQDYVNSYKQCLLTRDKQCLDTQCLLTFGEFLAALMATIVVYPEAGIIVVLNNIHIITMHVSIHAVSSSIFTHNHNQ